MDRVVTGFRVGVACLLVRAWQPTVLARCWGHVIRKFKSVSETVGDWFCDGRLPMLDRCGLGTLLWCFAHANIQHPELFRIAAIELQRPVRVRFVALFHVDLSILHGGLWFCPARLASNNIDSLTHRRVASKM